MKLAAFDFETANGSRLSACELGIALFEFNKGWKLSECRSWRFPPLEGGFARGNSRKHRIESADVEGLRSFDEIWSEAAPYFESDFLAAHNAIFDVDVLCRQLDHVGIARPRGEVICTLNMARKHLRELPAHGLAEICLALKIPFVHHVALSDSIACGRVLGEISSRFGQIDLRGEETVSIQDLQPAATLDCDEEYDDFDVGVRISAFGEMDEFEPVSERSRRFHEMASQSLYTKLLEGWSIAMTGTFVDGDSHRAKTAETLRRLGARCHDKGLVYTTGRNPIGPTNVLVIAESQLAEIGSGLEPTDKVADVVEMQRKGKGCVMMREKAFYDLVVEALSEGGVCPAIEQLAEEADMERVREAVQRFEIVN